MIKVQMLLMRNKCEKADVIGEFNPKYVKSISWNIPEDANFLQMNITEEEPQ